MRWLGAGSETPRPWLPDSGVTSPENAGVLVTTKGTTMAGKQAPSDGTYKHGTGNYRVKAGDAMPDGAEFTAADEAPKAEKRAKKAPAENRAKANDTENRTEN